ncbi:predicted protein [Naegleria gruberi]|uniref:Predicted protein n=1 Tax=Naegleria gruberi TaxID=5762 RepID=D2VML3_NAEGR|nr:uncharacterized protein NAEGRDRAFT_50798 [Naegleria gruberi]EFC42086.1 predicted protein [Naegleria gruberi]|eukprot:XP_002674830.1 predicted protein [Naegleria gruberi strain NEG-M]
MSERKRLSNGNNSKRHDDDDTEESEDEMPSLIDSDKTSEEDEDELPPLVESDDDELPPLVDSEASDSDDDLPVLIDDEDDSDYSDDENWETDSDDDDDEVCAEHYLGDDGIVYDRETHEEALPPLVSPTSSEDDEDSDEDEESESSSSSDDANFPLFMPSSRSASRVNQRSTINGISRNMINNNRQRIRATRNPPFVLPGLPPQFSHFPISDEEDLDVDEDSDEDSDDDNPFRSPQIRDTQGISHNSTRSGTHNKYWTQISTREKSKLDALYKNAEDSFKFTTSPASSSTESPIISIPIGNELQLSIHNMEEFLDGIIQIITSHSLHAMEVSSLFEYSRMAQKQVVQNRNILLLLALMLAIKIKYLKD